jgi:1,4-alpha-glucan branching enzyme
MLGPLLTEHDLYLLAEGTFRRPYERLGAHPIVLDGTPGTRFAVWAPGAAAVAVMGDFDGWVGAGHAMVRRGTTGIWEAFVPGVGPGDRYKYRIASRHHGHLADKADPYALRTEAPPGTASVVHDLTALRAFPWTDGAWLAGRPERQRPGRPLSVYEVHLGSWRRVPEEGNRHLTYRELATLLPPYAHDLGYTHVELMPITEYPSDASWGYQVTGYFAPTARYGAPEDLQAFVDACHAQGLGVILDWVPAHFAKEGHGLGLFDGTHLYEHADPRLGEHPVWGTYIFNYGRAEVRNFLLGSARFWLEEYHVDGFRVDAVASMIWLDHARPESHWGTNRYGGRENLEATDFLHRFNDMTHEAAPGAVTIAEESTSYTWVTRLPSPGGEGGRVSLGFDYKWNLGWMHDTLAYFEVDPVHRSAHHQRLTWPIWYAFDEQYLLPLSHDEVVHLKKALLTKMPGEDWQRFANLRALYAYQYAHPGKKLLFMGGEIGQWAEWSEQRSLDWHLLERGGAGGSQAPLHRGLQALLRDLNRAYATLPALHELDSQPRGFDWIEHGDTLSSVISFLRRGLEPGHVVAVVCNFTPVLRPDYPVDVPVPGEWEAVLNTDEPRYGGGGTGPSGSLLAPPGQGGGRYGQRLHLTLPPLGVVFLRPRPTSAGAPPPTSAGAPRGATRPAPEAPETPPVPEGA